MADEDKSPDSDAGPLDSSVARTGHDDPAVGATQGQAAPSTGDPLPPDEVSTSGHPKTKNDDETQRREGASGDPDEIESNEKSREGDRGPSDMTIHLAGSPKVGLATDKFLPSYFSPVEKESKLRTKRKLWDVDSKEVDDTLSRELKRIRKEEQTIKSSKWNFDFEREVPLQGLWQWQEEKDPPSFYKQKDVLQKNSSGKVSSSESSSRGESSSSPSTSNAPSSSQVSSSTSPAVPSSSSAPEASPSSLPPPPRIAQEASSESEETASSSMAPEASLFPESTNSQSSSGGAPRVAVSISPSSFYSVALGRSDSGSASPGESKAGPTLPSTSSASKRKSKRRSPNGSSVAPSAQSWLKHFR